MPALRRPLQGDDPEPIARQVFEAPAVRPHVVERMLTAIESCRRQSRDLLDFLVESILAHRSGGTPPSLIPAGALTVTRDAVGGSLNGDGSGVSGDAYYRNFKVLYGGYNGDGRVRRSDAVAIPSLVGTKNVFADLNGDGKVDLADVQVPLRPRNIRDVILKMW